MTAFAHPATPTGDTLKTVVSDRRERGNAMNVPSYPDRLLSLDEWSALPESDGHHVEVCEGVLIAAPRPGTAHDHAAVTLALLLDEKLPDEWSAIGGVEVLVAENPLTVRCPDVIVVGRSLVDADPDRAPIAEVKLVVEVTVDGTARTDRVTKFSEYAEAGVPQYWIVDLGGPPVLATFTLVDGWYRFDGEHSGTVTLDALGTEVTVTPSELVPAPVNPVAPAHR
ncbi:Uncharacterized protein conserved in cyanobacteria [Rhodococcus gordoniae]|uniref:Uncharacterized protein conserved in cyanobacteria n=2 Tax=Rhodococcus gordoniae TaxID=223392 RepID=A0A379M4L4_9NOCA|nr:Uncharacterized protein conserved in cyanobacteria [Rhodococcus gordoniae]